MATINVSNFSELKSAIEDSNSTEIIVTGDIVFSSGGAQINPTKGNISIDFGGYEVTDNNTDIITDTIYVPANSSAITITIKNATWNGKNKFGIVGVEDENNQVTVSYEGINFKGPLFSHNRSGITRIVDCEIIIDKNDSIVQAQELCKGNRIIFDGQVTINSNSSSESVIWFSNANSALTIEEDAQFEVNALYTYFAYTDTPPTFTFKKNSTSFINTQHGLFYGAGKDAHIASTFTLEEGATFASTQNEANSVPMFKCLTDFTLAMDSSFSLYSPNAGTAPLMYFGEKANITLSSPKRVVLYNNGGNVFSFQTGSESAPNTITLTTEMLRIWDNATLPVSSAGGLDDKASYNYHKAYYITEFNASFELSNTQVLSANSDLIALDEGYPISTMIPLLSSQVIALGKIDLYVDEISDLSTMISGETIPYANVRATFLGDSMTDNSANNGWFSFPLTRVIPVHTEILLEVNKDFLTKELKLISEGSLAITKLPQLDFYAFTRKPQSSTIYRVNTDWEIEVTDTREFGQEWYLYAYIDSPLMSQTGVLPGALRYQNATSIPLSSTPMLIYTGKWDRTNKVTKISWEKMKGFLLHVDVSQTYSAGRYTTTMQWMLTTDRLN